MSSEDQNTPVITVLSNEGERIALASEAQDLVETYDRLREGIPLNWTLPFSSEMIGVWDFVHSARALYLYPRVKEVFDYLGVGQLSLHLQDHQHAWTEHLLEILATHQVAIDTTPLGGGKTYQNAYAAQALGLRVLAICPASVKPVWEAMRPALPGLIVMSYGELRSERKGDGSRTLKHGYLVRHDNSSIEINSKNENTLIHHVEFSPTQALRDLCASGLFVVIDEFQKIKNLSAQQKACQAVIGAVREGKLSVASLLSGSPLDKLEHCANLMRTLGFIHHPYLLRVLPGYNRDVQYLGLKELIESVRTLDQHTTERVIRQTGMPQRRNEADKLVWELFKRVVKPTIAGGSPKPIIPYKENTSNTLFILSDEDATRYTFAVGELKASLIFDPMTGAILGTDHITMMTALENMEAAACNAVAKDVVGRLSRDPMCQAIVFCTFRRTYALLSDILEISGYEVGILSGAVGQSKRNETVDRFQRGELRVMIAGVEVGGVGLSFHDRLGGRRRYSWIFPSWNAISMYQCTGRTYRPGVKSDTSCEFVYCAQMPAGKIIDAIHRKSEVIRETLANPDAGSIKLPGEYPFITRAPGKESRLPTTIELSTPNTM